MEEKHAFGVLAVVEFEIYTGQCGKFFFLLLLLFIVSRKAVHDFRKCVPAVEITEKNERDCREEIGIDKRYTACVFMYSCLISSGV